MQADEQKQDHSSLSRVDAERQGYAPPVVAVAILEGRHLAADSRAYARQIKRLRTAADYRKVATCRVGRVTWYSRADTERLRDRLVRRGVGAGASRRRFASLVRGWAAREQGFIRLADAALKLQVDARVLSDLLERDEIKGKPVAAPGNRDDTWLVRRSLAAYCFSRPRCVVEGCGRRVIGRQGPGCSRHRAHGRHHSRESVRKGANARRRYAPVERVCEWCGEAFTLPGGKARQVVGRFCSEQCQREWLRAGAAERLPSLRKGRLEWLQRIARFKAENQLLDATEVAKALPRELRRHPMTVLEHAAAEESPLQPVPVPAGRGGRPVKSGPRLFSPEVVPVYAAWLRSHPDGRLRRFERPRFRAQWHLARHKSTAAFGPLTLTAGRSLAARRLESAVEALWGSQLTHEEIGREVGISPRHVRRIAQRLGLPARRPGRRAANSAHSSRGN